ncbi:hypothetical protein [Rhodohalobacter sulfatireducens]|uniref:DUF4294 domain-containing protein n=1 Tax=Rhodohalobacter sulfatireducens TaxID=2911366 RepID=A0ABS9K858_9BACT|nr:hypothetical protein [Rhodohalobacter sulfatireducens]MCG2587042.1 hypothetical protein [Rhodohalobacter sulfatireducens]
MNTKLTISEGWFLRSLLLIFVISLCSATLTFAQTEDSTETERQELQEEETLESTPNESETPYRMDLLESDINRYQLRDYGSTNRFYRQLEYMKPEEFLMRGEEGYQRYGEEWERKINEDLLAIIRATFKEDSEIMKLWKSIAPFLSFGIWEPYEVPITRVDYPSKVPVETVEEQ